MLVQEQRLAYRSSGRVELWVSYVACLLERPWTAGHEVCSLMRFVRWSRMMEHVLGQRSIYGGDLLCVLSGAWTWSHSRMGEMELSQM